MTREDFDRWEKERRERLEQHERRREERRRERQQAEADREQADAGERARKERVLHTRISDSLDRAIRHAADELRVPVSNLVRNVLEDAFDVVEKVTDNVGDIVEEVLEEVGGVRKRLGRTSAREREERGEPLQEQEGARDPDPSRPEFPDVIGWQPLILNGAQRCSDCGRDLARGDRGFVGLGASGVTSHYLCSDCAGAR